MHHGRQFFRPWFGMGVRENVQPRAKVGPFIAGLGGGWLRGLLDVQEGDDVSRVLFNRLS